MRQRTDHSTGTGTALAVSSVASVQFGAALAATLFPLIGPLGTVALRLLGASVILVLLTRPWRVRWSRTDLRTATVFGLVFVVMNVSLYIAISRLPLATGITIEFLGPLGVAVATATSWRQRGWALPAAVGVALLGGSLHTGDLIGVGAALVAALGWASYILLSRRMGQSDVGLAGLAMASVLGAVIVLPVGAVSAGAALWHPGVLAIGLAVGVVSSAVPYSLDLLALRRLPTAVFGVLTSLNPAVAALAGLLVLGEHLPGRQLIGIAFVTAASAGITLSGRSSARRPGRSSARRPAHSPAGQDVRMDVEDRLAHTDAGVEDGAKVGQFLRGDDTLDSAQDRGGTIGVEFGQVSDVHPGDDQDVRRGLRTDVAKGETDVVRIDNRGRDVAADDRAEQAIHSWTLTHRA